MNGSASMGTIEKIDDHINKVERAKNSPKDLTGILVIRDTVSTAWLSFSMP